MENSVEKTLHEVCSLCESVKEAVPLKVTASAIKARIHREGWPESEDFEVDLRYRTLALRTAQTACRVLSIANPLRRIVERKEFSWRQLTEQTGLPHNTIYAYAHGYYRVPMERRIVFRDTLGIPLDAWPEVVYKPRSDAPRSERYRGGTTEERYETIRRDDVEAYSREHAGDYVLVKPAENGHVKVKPYYTHFAKVAARRVEDSEVWRDGRRVYPKVAK